MNGEKVKIKILPLWVIGQQSRTNEPFAAIWLRALPENKWQFPSLIVTEQKSKFTESARNELAPGPACPMKFAQTKLHSVTEQKSEFIEGVRNELAAGTACPLKSAQTRLHSVTEQKSEFIESARNELAAGTACPLKSAQTRLHSVTEQKSKFTKIGRNELAAGPACPPEIRYIFFPSGRKSRCCRRPAGGKQQSTGLLHSDGSNLL